MRYKKLKVVNGEPVVRRGNVLYLWNKATLLSFKCPLSRHIVTLRIESHPTKYSSTYHFDIFTNTVFPSIKKHGHHYSIVNGKVIIHKPN